MTRRLKRSTGPWPLVALLIGLSACSVPSLESAECLAARDVVKQYYSLAIGGDPMSHPDVLVRLKSMLSPDFSSGPLDAGADRFHFSRVAPTSSRVGECTLQPDGRVRIAVKVIWRIDEKNSLRDDVATLVQVDGKWLIERIDVGDGAPPAP